MRFVYNAGSLPPISAELVRELDQAATRLVAKLTCLDVNQLSVPVPFKKVLNGLVSRPDAAMRKYVHLMAWALYPQGLTTETTFIDYGGGHGLMACLAKECGVPRVLYNDVFEPHCHESQALATAMGCSADAYISGDIKAVARALQARTPRHCVLVSVNVIEHIYDLDEFLIDTARICREKLTLVLSTSANPFNPFVRARHFRQHREWEFQDGPHEDATPGWDSDQAFYTLRREIITQASPQLNLQELERLSKATRGLRKDDIEKRVAYYLMTGDIGKPPEHPTNTCDPVTGNWQERLLDSNHVIAKLNALGFRAGLFGGYYDMDSGTGVVRFVKKPFGYMANHLISLLGRNGVWLGPCMTFHASRS